MYHKIKSKKKFLYAAKLCFLFAGLFLVIHFLDFGKIVLIVERTNLYLLFLAFLLSHLAAFLFSLRNWWIYKAFKINVSIYNCYKVRLQSQFYQLIVPSSAATDTAQFLKIYNLTEKNHLKRTIIFAILSDRITGLLSALTITTIAFLFLYPGLLAKSILYSTTINIVVGISFLGFVLASYYFRNLIFDSIKNISLYIASKAFLTSLLMQLSLCISIFIVSESTQTNLSLLQVIFAISASVCLQSIPISALGFNAGDMFGILIFHLIGANKNISVLLIGSLYFFRIINASIGGCWELKSSVEKYLKIKKK